MRYSVVGLGKLGASMAAAIASRGFDVVGVDVAPQAVAAINAGQAPVEETGLDALVAANTSRLRATMDVTDAVRSSDVTFVVVPTPSDERGAFSLRYATAAFEAIGRALAEKTEYHLVVMSSTVLPGATRHGLLPLLEQYSGRVAGRDFGLCYSPEFIALGSVIRDFLNPDFALVGEFDDRSGALLERCYAEFMQNDPPCRRMSLENAELTKISVNTYVTTKITFANMLADLCARIPGGDVDVVTHALGSDLRIGSRYLTGALGYGGPCFPRDNLALGFLARALGADAGLAETTDRMNRALADKLADRYANLVAPGTPVSVLGLSYKPASHVLEESQGLALARVLADRGARVRAFDPLAARSAAPHLEPQVMIVDSLREAVAGAEVVFVTNPDPAFTSLTAEMLQPARGPVTVVDFWRKHRGALDGAANVRYVPFGCLPSDDAAATNLLRELWGAPVATAH
jgi:UDPglucose 6-dehydrogenase